MGRFAQHITQNVKHFSTNMILSAVCHNPMYGPLTLMRSELMNGIRVAAAEISGALIAACTIMFQAGSRYETHDDLGATHFLRTASTGSGCRATAFAKLRVLQQNGAYITTTSDRQTIAYTLRCPMPLFNELKYYLLDTAANCCYHDWEISDLKTIVRGDLTRISPEQRVMDLVQKAAWAGPLANSVFCEDERIDNMNGEKLRNYANLNYTPYQCTVASIGVPFEDTMKIAEKINTNTEREPLLEQPQTFPRAGHEYYDLGSGSDTWIAVAVPGCGSFDLHNLLKHAIIASACGNDNLQMGNGLDRIPQPPLGWMYGNDIFTDYKAFNISYAETGLFGILGKAPSESASRTATMAAEFLANVDELDFAQIEEGKKRLRNDHLCTSNGSVRAYFDTRIIEISPSVKALSNLKLKKSTPSLRGNYGSDNEQEYILDFVYCQLTCFGILELSLAIHNEDCMKVCEDLALQTAHNVQLDCIDNALNMIQSIYPDEITKTAKTLSSNCNKMAIAVVGDIGVMPVDQEIFKRC